MPTLKKVMTVHSKGKFICRNFQKTYILLALTAKGHPLMTPGHFEQCVTLSITLKWLITYSVDKIKYCTITIYASLVLPNLEGFEAICELADTWNMQNKKKPFALLFFIVKPFLAWCKLFSKTILVKSKNKILPRLRTSLVCA